jgi:hypothetical protein
MTGLQSNLRIGARIGFGHFGDVHLGQDDVHGTWQLRFFGSDRTRVSPTNCGGREKPGC